MFCFFFNDKANTDIYTYSHTLSLHDALPIYEGHDQEQAEHGQLVAPEPAPHVDSQGSRLAEVVARGVLHELGLARRRGRVGDAHFDSPPPRDRKSTRLNSSH